MGRGRGARGLIIWSCTVPGQVHWPPDHGGSLEPVSHPPALPFLGGAADHAIFEMLVSGGVLLGIALVMPRAARWSLDTLIGLGRRVLVAGTLGFLDVGVAAWWLGAAVFGVGLGLLEMASTIRAQHLTAPAVRGRVIGALLAFNAVGLGLGAGLAALPLPLWPAARRRHERTQRLSASSSA